MTSDTPVDLGGKRQRALLARLMIGAGAPVTYAQLIAAIWDEPPATARQQIHNIIRQLRELFGRIAARATIEYSKIGYTARVDVQTVDLWRFRADVADATTAESAGHAAEAVALLEQATALWRGPALVEFETTAMTTWAHVLNEERLAACEHLGQLLLAQRQHHKLIRLIRPLVAEHHLNESLRGMLMTALYRSGRDTEALDVYEQGRVLVREELGTDPGAGLRRLHVEILRDTTDASVDDTTAVSFDDTEHEAQTPAAFLPYSTPDFTGRTTELEHLFRRAAGRGNGLTVIAIDGMGGIGKTALAVRAAHELSSAFPDGQYFLDLRGFSEHQAPLSPSDALELLLRAAGAHPRSIPPDLELRVQMWRASTASKRVLIVLDNASRDEQVLPLLPGTASGLAIVTSRRRLQGIPGASTLTLEPLPGEDALDLFVRIADTTRPGAGLDGARQVVEICGRLPLAIRVVAARFRSRPTWTISDIVQRLTVTADHSGDPLSDGTGVSTTFELSYRYLSHDHQRLFRLLALQPLTDFDAFSTAAIGAISVSAANELLETLFEDNLIEEHSPFRFRFHDLVHRYGRQLSKNTDTIRERDDSTRRLLNYYLAATDAWCRPIGEDAFRVPIDLTDPRPAVKPAGASRDERLRHVAVEHSNIVTAIRLAANRAQHRLAWQLTCTIDPYLTSLSYGGESLELVELAITSAEKDDSVRGRATLLTIAAYIHRNRGSVSLARQTLDDAMRIGGTTTGASLRSFQCMIHGSDRINEQDFDAARTSFREARRLAEQTSDPIARSSAINSLGVLARETGRYEEAIDLLTEALDIMTAAGVSTATTMLNIGSTHHDAGNYDAALVALRDGHATSTSLNAAHSMSCGLAFLSATIRCLGDRQEAKRLAEDSLRIATDRNLVDMRAEALCALGEAEVALGNLDDAQQCFTDAIAIAKPASLQRFTGRGLEGLAHVMLARGDAHAARQQWELAFAAYPDAAGARQGPIRHLTDPGTVCVRCLVGPPSASSDVVRASPAKTISQ